MRNNTTLAGILSIAVVVLMIALGIALTGGDAPDNGEMIEWSGEMPPTAIMIGEIDSVSLLTVGHDSVLAFIHMGASIARTGVLVVPAQTASVAPSVTTEPDTSPK